MSGRSRTGARRLLLLALLAAPAVLAQPPEEPAPPQEEGAESEEVVPEETAPPQEEEAEPEEAVPEETAPPQEDVEPEEAAQEGTAGERPAAPDLPKRLPERVAPELLPEVDVAFRADADCVLRIDGLEVGTLASGETAVFPLRVGQHLVRAVSERYPEAEFRRTVRVREGAELGVAIKLDREIWQLHRKQRRERILRREEGPRPLMWVRNDNGVDVRWGQAQAYCDELLLGGYEDWRLPSLEELESIQAIWSVAPIKTIGAFRLSACCPWSSEREGDQRAWNFNFRFRKKFLGNVAYSLGLRALCVRDWDPEQEEGREAAPEESQPEGADGGRIEPPAW